MIFRHCVVSTIIIIMFHKKCFRNFRGTFGTTPAILSLTIGCTVTQSWKLYVSRAKICRSLKVEFRLRGFIARIRLVFHYSGSCKHSGSGDVESTHSSSFFRAPESCLNPACACLRRPTASQESRMQPRHKKWFENHAAETICASAALPRSSVFWISGGHPNCTKRPQ